MKKIIFFIILCITVNLYSQNKIKKIEFYTDGYASAPDFDIIIYADKTALFIAKSDNYKEEVKGDIVAYGINKKGISIKDSEIVGIYKTKLKRKTFNEIRSLINALKEEFIKQKYTSNQLHNSEGKLVVSLKRGKSITIHDIGLNGTDKLIKLYNYFKVMRFKEKWE